MIAELKVRLGGDYEVMAFDSRESYLGWLSNTPRAMSQPFCDSVAARATREGVESKFLGFIPPARVSCTGLNYRETLAADGLNARQRAVLDVFSVLPIAASPYAARIYATEGITALAQAIRARYPRFIGSEYAPDAASAARIFPILHQDLAALTYPDAGFDVAISNEVLEHVPHLNASLRQLQRILAPGGILLATFPFLSGSYETSFRAELRDGVVHHLAEPEFHGNPIDPDAGSLVFQVPGWDILVRCKEAGFARAEMIYVASERAALVAADLSGILMLMATA